LTSQGKAAKKIVNLFFSLNKRHLKASGEKAQRAAAVADRELKSAGMQLKQIKEI
jgi:hypothetical protein